MSGGVRAEVTFSGLERLREWAARFASVAKLGAALDEDLMAACEPIVEDARRLAPRRKVGSRHGAESIHAEPAQGKERKKGEAAIVIGPDPDHWYLRFSEFGTRKMMPRPFMRPAFHSRVSQAIAILGERLNARIRGA
jgi:HK97 gp10 family phage protein